MTQMCQIKKTVIQTNMKSTMWTQLPNNNQSGCKFSFRMCLLLANKNKFRKSLTI